MAKKSFKIPALNFMSDAVEPEEEQTATTTPDVEPSAPATPAEPATPKTDHVPATPKPKPTAAPGYEKVAVTMDDLKVTKRETKTQRFNFVFQPSLVDAIRRASKQLDMSANEFCSQVLKRYLKERGFFNE